MAKKFKIKQKPVQWDVKGSTCIHKDHSSLPACGKPAVQTLGTAHGWLCEAHQK